MKKASLVAVFLLVTAVLHGQTGNYDVKRTFVSPNGSLTAAVGAQPSGVVQAYPFIYSLGVINNGSFVLLQELPLSRYFSEYHGTGWLAYTQPRWIDNRFLVFADSFGLAIVDVKNRRLLIDHVFTAYEKSPVADKWAAIRLRATARLQPQLNDDFEDAVLVIDPYDVANQIASASEDNFVGQMKVAKPGGIVLTTPQWTPNGSAFAILIWNQGSVDAVRYDANLNETGRVALNLQVDRESALSLSLPTNVAQKAKSILANPTIFR